MKVIVSLESFAEALSLANGATKARTPLESLGCVHLSAKDNALYIRATDNTKSVMSRLPLVQVEQDGEVLVPADKLAKIASECLEETLHLENDGGAMLHVRGVDSHFELYTRPPATLPPEPVIEDAKHFVVSAANLVQLFKLTAFASGRIGLPQFNTEGVFLSIHDSEIIAVGTNGSRLALSKSVTSDANIKIRLGFLVPKPVVELFLKLAVDSEEDVLISVGENRMSLELSETKITSVLLQGEYPPYPNIIPSPGVRVHKADVSTHDFIAKVRQAALMTETLSERVVCSFTEKTIVFTSQSPSAGECKLSLPCKYVGEPIEVAMNANIIADGLEKFTDERISVEIENNTRPVMFIGKDGYQFMVSPMGLKGAA